MSGVYMKISYIQAINTLLKQAELLADNIIELD